MSDAVVGLAGSGAGVSGIFDWVRGATVVITGESADGGREPIGSGFFVAPGWVLSCAHVVAPTRNPRVTWQDHDLEPSKIICHPEAVGPDGRFAFPDTAVLEVPIPNPEPPCVPLAPCPPAPTHRVWTRGLSKIRTGRLEPFASVLEVADADADGFIRLQNGQLGLGMSGGPVLDLETFEVCGIMKAIQEEQTLLGGWAIPIGAALAVAPGCVAKQNAEYHGETLRALRAGQLMFGRLPDKVLALFEDHPGAAKLLAGYLPMLGLTRPETVTDEQLPEWAVRRLFDLDLNRLIEAVLVVKDNLGAEATKAVFDYVCCCLPVDEGPAWWVAGEAADELYREATANKPRIVRVSTDEQLTVRVLMRRTFQERPWCFSPIGGPFSARAGDNGVPAETLADIKAEIFRKGGATQRDWDDEKRRKMITQRLRRFNVFFGLRVDATPDSAQLKDLTALFEGLLFLICRRTLILPDDIDDVLLDLNPPIDPDGEWAGVSGSALLDEQLGRTG
jgi:Trypsin-like peptidase domain